MSNWPFYLIIYIILLVVVSAYAIYKWRMRQKEQQNFIENLKNQHGMSKDAAEMLDQIEQAHKRVVYNKKFIRYDSHFRKLDNHRVRAAHTYDFYMLNRWIHRLNNAKRQGPHEMYSEVDTIIQQMTEKASEYSIKDEEREHILELARQPNDVLEQYDGMYLKGGIRTRPEDII